MAEAARILATTLAVSLLWKASGAGADCNRNGVLDDEDIAQGTATDCNGNGVPDSCDVVPTVDFEAVLAVPAGDGVHSVAAGDLDGDGQADLVAGGDGVTVLRSRGSFEFVSQRPLLVRDGADGVRVGDLDGDADQDVVALHAGKVTVFENAGDGTLAVKQALPDQLEAMTTPMLCLADVDGDGDLDAVVGMGRGNGIGIFRNDGHGVLSSPESLELASDDRFWVAPIDLEGNGTTDLAVTVKGRARVQLLLNRGDGRLDVGSWLSCPRPPESVAAGDLDGDGDQDLVAPCSTSSAAFFWNDGGGAFVVSELGLGRKVIEVAIFDMDGDGLEDVAFGSHEPLDDFSVVLVLRNAGERRFETVGEFSAGSRAVALAPGDFDADGHQDLAVAGGLWVVNILRNSGRGTFRAGVPLPGSSVVNPTRLQALDLEGDGDPDLASLTPSGEVRTFVNLGGAVFQDGALYKIGRNTSWIETGDLDGQNGADVVVADRGSEPSDPNGAVYVLFNPGDASAYHSLRIEAGRHPQACRVADLNGDGRLDIVVANWTSGGSRLDALVNDGRGEFSPSAQVELPGIHEGFLSVLDLEGDHDLDLVVPSYDETGTLYLLRNHGDATFDVESLVVAPSRLPVYGHVGTEGDVDGDGSPDLVIAGDFTGTAYQVTFLGNDGLGGLSVRQAIETSAGLRRLILSDGDGDGDPDLFGLSTGSTAVQFFQNDGRGRFAEPRHYFAGGGPMGLAVADFDGIGGPDFVTTQDSKEAFLWFSSNVTVAARSRDEDDDGVPDECMRAQFHRGDPNDDGLMNIADPVRILRYLFGASSAPSCLETADTNNDGSVATQDAVLILEFLFADGPPPAAPGPVSDPCGLDPDPPLSDKDVGCASYARC